ncbi:MULTISPECIES: hypothetical protein [unclassified Blastomonas]|jgi:hypothetical protein|uniref:hypothetical protein n=1 Tax=unclassified Blastomonas TaxID=2626550 RepID=UPI00082621D5|nr:MULTISPECIES: hypothetical protein [unclassified Blastomonas]
MQDELTNEIARVLVATQAATVENRARALRPLIAREVATHLTDAAEYLDGYSGGHHMAQSCAQVLRKRADAIRSADNAG